MQTTEKLFGKNFTNLSPKFPYGVFQMLPKVFELLVEKLKRDPE